VPFPVVVVSSGEPICDQYNITSRNIKELLDGGLVEPFVEESFMIYGQESANGHLQIGIMAAIDLEDCQKNVVKRHELCIPDLEVPVSTRLKQYRALYVDPIMVMYRQQESVDEIISRIVSQEDPISIDNRGDNSGNHFVWPVKDKEVNTKFVFLFRFSDVFCLCFLGYLRDSKSL
jgi:uncharacterized protein (DUF1015 family)